MDKNNEECNGIWMAFDYWCGCVGYGEQVCLDVENDMSFVFDDAEMMIMQSAREEMLKLGGKDVCKSKDGCKKKMKPFSFKRSLRKRIMKEREDKIALLAAAQETETS